MDAFDHNLFMVCSDLNRSATTSLPPGFHMRLCRSDEVDVWMDMQFDSFEEAAEHRPFMEDWFERVYESRGSLFVDQCTFICNDADFPVATAFTFPMTSGITTVHWLKVVSEYEGIGLGRAMLSYIMEALDSLDFPVLLHTHPTSQRAIKLYSDLGFDVVTDPQVGSRLNDLEKALPYLKDTMSNESFRSLRYVAAPETLIERLQNETTPEF